MAWQDSWGQQALTCPEEDEGSGEGRAGPLFWTKSGEWEPGVGTGSWGQGEATFHFNVLKFNKSLSSPLNRYLLELI